MRQDSDELDDRGKMDGVKGNAGRVRSDRGSVWQDRDLNSRTKQIGRGHNRRQVLNNWVVASA